MSTSWTNAIATAELDGGHSGRITSTRIRSSKPHAQDLVVVESEHLGSLYLSPVQAADLAEQLAKVSGMASSTTHAQFLGQ